MAKGFSVKVTKTTISKSRSTSEGTDSSVRSTTIVTPVTDERGVTA